MTFEPGEIVKIVANNTSPPHNIPLGTEVEILREFDSPRHWYIQSPYKATGAENWAIESDLEKLPSPEQLDAEVRQRLGIEPPTHCHACGQALP